jgi:hypothetical protein
MVGGDERLFDEKLGGIDHWWLAIVGTLKLTGWIGGDKGDIGDIGNGCAMNGKPVDTEGRMLDIAGDAIR